VFELEGAPAPCRVQSQPITVCSKPRPIRRRATEFAWDNILEIPPPPQLTRLEDVIPPPDWFRSEEPPAKRARRLVPELLPVVVDTNEGDSSDVNSECCPICMEEFEPGATSSEDEPVASTAKTCVTLRCLHKYCISCWDGWVRKRGGEMRTSCPVCRRDAYHLVVPPEEVESHELPASIHTDAIVTATDGQIHVDFGTQTSDLLDIPSFDIPSFDIPIFDIPTFQAFDWDE
jgi:hypothetical protein